MSWMFADELLWNYNTLKTCRVLQHLALHGKLYNAKVKNAKVRMWQSIKCEIGVLRKRRVSMYKMRKMKNAEITLKAAVYFVANLQVTLAFVVVNFEQVAECSLSLWKIIRK